MRNDFTAVLERDGEWFIAYCPETPGANGQGSKAKPGEFSEAIALILELRGRRLASELRPWAPWSLCRYLSSSVSSRWLCGTRCHRSRTRPLGPGGELNDLSAGCRDRDPGRGHHGLRSRRVPVRPLIQSLAAALVAMLIASVLAAVVSAAEAPTRRGGPGHQLRRERESHHHGRDPPARGRCPCRPRLAGRWGSVGGPPSRHHHGVARRTLGRGRHDLRPGIRTRLEVARPRCGSAD